MKSKMIKLQKRAVAPLALGMALMLGATACSGAAKSETDDSGAAQDNGNKDVSLVIASWGDPFSTATMEHLAKPFMEETGYTVQIVDAPGKFVAGIEAQAQANNVEWDLLDSTSGPDAYIAYEKGLIQKTPEDVKERLLQHLPETAVTDFGIAWSILGYISACNEDAVDACPTSTAELFDVENFPGARTSISTSPLVNLSMAEIASGVSIEDLATHEIDMDRAFGVLEKFNDAGGTWWSSGDQNMQVFLTGEVDMGISYSGRAYATADEMDNLSIVWKDGLYNPGFLNVVEGSNNSAEAWEFIEWVAANPEASANWAVALGYSVPNPDSFNFIPEETAITLSDYPANRELLGVMNYDWYVENYEEVNDRWQEFLRG